MQKSRLIVASAALALLAGVAGPASAQQKMRPGLWEYHISMKKQIDMEQSGKWLSDSCGK